MGHGGHLPSHDFFLTSPLSKLKPLPHTDAPPSPPPLKNEVPFQKMIPRKKIKKSKIAIDAFYLCFTPKRWQKSHINMIFLIGAFKILSEK